MKQKTAIKLVASVFCAVLTSTTVFAGSTTWNGTGAWGNATSWDNGLPNATTDAVVSKVNPGAQSLNIPNGSTFQNLIASNGISDALDLYAGTLGSPIIGTAASFHSSGSANATIRLIVNGVNLSDTLLFTSNSTATHAAALQMNVGSNLTVTNGIVLGGNNTSVNNVALVNANIGGNTTLINADITFNKGSRYWSTADSGTGTLAINGNVTLQAGSYAGPNATFDVGRASVSDNGFTVKVRDHFAASSASASVWKGKTLEVGSATFSSNSSLVLKGYAGLTGNAVFRSQGDVVFDGGWLNNNTAAGDSGAFLLDVGGNFVLRTGSAVSLRSEALGVTTLQLGKNFDIQATSLSGGNLTQLRVTLTGSGPQTLEAAVTNSNSTFSIYSLTLNDSYVSLVDSFTNFASGEFFKTTNLVNNGNSTLQLNGLKFFVDGTELTEGSYTSYGGTLNVIPEPSTLWLIAGALGGLFAWRRCTSRTTKSHLD